MSRHEDVRLEMKVMIKTLTAAMLEDHFAEYSGDMGEVRDSLELLFHDMNEVRHDA